MKKLILLAAVMLFAVSCDKNDVSEDLTIDNAFKSENAKEKCATIQSGDLMYAAGHNLEGEALTIGYDIFGYNYEAHLFRGSYANVYLGREGFAPYTGDDESYLADYPGAQNKWYWPYRNYEIVMKWNDAWLSNQDCDDDGVLDRHLGFESYIGSGAWEMYSEKIGGDSDYTYTCKIVAVPADATKIGGIWYNADGIEIGAVIWEDFAITQEVYGGFGAEEHGLLYKGMDHTGLGNW